MKKLITLIGIILIASANTFGYITVTDDIYSDQTWTSGNTYFISTYYLNIENDATLTIEEGVVVKFENGLGISSSYGTLDVNGQSSTPVIFTSMHDNSVGETISGSTGTPNPGDWGLLFISTENWLGIITNAVANISYADFRYGSRIDFDSELASSLDHVFIHHFDDYGLYVDYTPITADNLDVSNCEKGIYLKGISTSDFTNIWLNNISDPALLTLNYCEIAGMSSWNISGNTGQHILLSEKINGNSELVNIEPLVYVLEGDSYSDRIAVNNLVVQEGAILKFPDETRLSVVDGTLDINGSETYPVIFTSVKDDEFGGDTNGDGNASVPDKGDWNCIHIDGINSSTFASAKIDWAWIRFGGFDGGGYSSSLEFKGSTDPSYIKDSRIEYSGQNGINVYQCSPSIYSNTFLNNDSSDVRILDNISSPNLGSSYGNQGKNIFRKGILDINNTTTNSIDAMYNDWGTGDSTAISQRVGNNDPGTGEITFAPIYQEEDTYWHNFGKSAIENAGVYNQLALDYEDTPAGTTILYQTGEGRYGKMNILQRTITTMALRWETYNSDGTTYSAGTNLLVGGAGDDDLCELDRGIRGTFLNEQNDAEFYINADGAILNIGNTKFLVAYSYCTPEVHGGGTSSNQLWTRGTHYIPNDFTIYDGDTLTIEPGSVIKFAQGKDLIVKGTIIAIGTQNDSIYFTSANDDSQGCIIDGSTGSPQPDDWGYISLNGNAGEANSGFRFCKFSYGGDGSAAMLTYQYSATGFLKQCTVERSSSDGLQVYQADITVDSCTFQNNDNHGIEYVYYAYVRVNNSNFLNNGNFAIVTGGCDIAPCWNNHAEGNNLNGMVIMSLGTSPNQSLSNQWSTTGGMPFIVFSGLNIASGDYLNVHEGTLIKMNASAQIKSSGGKINIFGATITSIKDDSKGGDTNNDGNATSPAPGDWKNIEVLYNTETSIDQSHIFYGGSTTAAIKFSNGGGGHLNNTEVRYSQNSGIYSSTSPLDLWACTFSDNLKSGVYVYSGDSTEVINCDINNNGEHGIMVAYSSAEIRDNEILDNAQYAIYYYSTSSLKTPITGNIMDGNLMDAVVINSLDWYYKQQFFEVTGNQSSIKYSYVFLNTANIYSTTDTLEFNTGTVVKFNEQIYLQTRGAILADGAIFTSLHDDSFGGDTENDGAATSPAKGDWSYIGVDNGGLAEFDNCNIRYAGYNNYSSVRYYTNATGFVKNSTVEFSYQDGISKYGGGNVEISNNVISENDRYGINLNNNQDTLIIDGNEIKQSGSHAIYLISTFSTDINNNAFEDNGGYPVYYTGTSTINDIFTGNTSSGNLMEGFAINSINGYSHNILYPQNDLPFIFLNNITSYATTDTLEIKSSTIIKMFPDVKLEFRGPVITNGGLITSIKDDAWGGDTNNDGEATVAAPGDWRGLELYNTWGDFGGLIIRYAGASSTPALNFNTTKGNISVYIDSCAYDGLNLYNGTNVEVNNAHLVGNARYGINVNSVDTVKITYSTLQGNGSHGINNLYAAPDMDNNTFTDNGGYPVYFTTGSIIDKEFTGNTSSGNLMEGFAISAFNGYAHNILYHQDDLPFIFPNNIISYATVDTFQIEQATCKFLPNVELEFRGPVITNGGVLTSINDDVWDGDSNNDGLATNPAPGDWRGIEVYNTQGEFNDTRFRYGGASSSPALYLNTSNGYVDVTIDSSSYDGLFLYNADNVVVENSDFIGNARYGININSVDTCHISNSTLQGNGSHGIYNKYAAPDLDNLTFTDNGGYPVYFSTNSIINKEFTGNSSSGNLMEGFAISAFNGYAHNILYHQDDLPFIFPNNIISYATADTFQIEQATCKFLPNVELEFRGPVITNGGVLTSINDDVWDGDSNNDGLATNPAPGDWRGVELYHTLGEFNGTSFRYGGSSSPALYFNASNGYVDVTIDSSSYDGLFLYNADNVVVENSDFIGNGRYGVNINNVDTCHISNSVLQGNGSHAVYMQYSNTNMRGNTIINNSGYGIYNYYVSTLNLGNNDVNDKGENIITGNDGGNYQLYNNTANEINAYYNDWGYNTAAEIDAHIYDNDEDGSKGEVHFNPWYLYNLAVGVKVFLEGPFNGTEMSTYLAGHPEPVEGFPLAQPFNTDPWNYAGTESVVSIPNADVVDWVLLELRDAADAASAGTGTIIDRKAGFLLKDGSIVEKDGASTLSFAANISQNLFVVIHHRNHLKMMSANALTQSAGVYTYDFSTDVNQAYQSSEKLVNGKAVMYGGDANADGSINTSDAAIWVNEAGTTGYLKTDVTFDGQSDNKDKNDVWVPNNGTDNGVPQ